MCLYGQNAGLSGSHTDYKYYGYDNFSDVVGTHYLLNNQTGDAWVRLCYNYGGTDCTAGGISSGSPEPSGFAPALHGNFKLINSIKLSAT